MTWYEWTTWLDIIWSKLTWLKITWYYLTWTDLTWVTCHDVILHDTRWHDITWYDKFYDLIWHDMIDNTLTLKTVPCAHSNNKKNGVCTLAVHSAVCTFAQLSVASAPFQEPGKSTQPPGLRQWLLPVLGQCFICSLQKKQPYLTWYSTCVSVGHILIRKSIKFWLLYSFWLDLENMCVNLCFIQIDTHTITLIT